MNPLKRILNLFCAPGELFAHLQEKPDWFIPFLVVAVFSLAAFAVVYPIYTDFQYEVLDQMVEDGKLNEEQAVGAYQSLESPVRMTIEFASRPVVFLLVILMQALFLYLGSNMLGGDGTFKRGLAVVSYSNLVFVLGAIVNTILVFLKRDIMVGLNLSKVLPADMADAGGFLQIIYKILGHFDVFQIWALVLMSIGVSITMSLSRNKGYGLVFTLWGIWIAVSIVISEVFSGFIAA